jgi:membrane-associated phospholipid phosphatase
VLADLLGWLERLDQDLFERINHALHRPRRAELEAFLAWAGQLGSGWMGVGFAAAILLLVRPWRRALLRLLEAAVVLGGLGGLVGAIKSAVGRPRPPKALAALFEQGRVFMGFGEHGKINSFPSGHTTTAFAAATLLVLWAPPRRRLAVGITCALLASATGCARIYAGMHFPGDVLAGALLGVLGALLVDRIGRRVGRLLAGRRQAAAPLPPAP